MKRRRSKTRIRSDHDACKTGKRTYVLVPATRVVMGIMTEAQLRYADKVAFTAGTDLIGVA